MEVTDRFDASLGGKRPFEIDEDETEAPKRAKRIMQSLSTPFIACIKTNAESLLKLSQRFEPLESFSQAGTPGQDLKLQSMVRETNDTFEEIDQCLIEFFPKLKAACDKISKSLGYVEKRIATNEYWWEAGNVVTWNAMPGLIDSMFEQTGPKDTERFAQYLRTQMEALQPQTFEQSQIQENNIKRMLEQIDRLNELPNAGWLCFDLWMDMKIQYLQPPQAVSILRQNKDQHDEIDEHFRDLLNPGMASFPARNIPYLNCAQRCREIRKAMNCAARGRGHLFRKDICLHDIMLPTLDIIQRNAYLEILIQVQRATRAKLPAELIDMVFEFTLAAEGVPLDPRIILLAQHRDTNKSRTKCRFPCKRRNLHAIRNGYVQGPEWNIKAQWNRWIHDNRPKQLWDSDGEDLFSVDRFEYGPEEYNQTGLTQNSLSFIDI
ncbi:hypothetical protein B0J11DRAFT_537594 [Dendryphion nanum]|uniref:Uncharacterized protein n=1 Tax=Dendryphion nanum TaxID=256645 RepID=A0A9P9DD71_9PLEO|nr:hypothetical protein B0J11DRAFT_537594 [Dendryphion nanum]